MTKPDKISKPESVTPSRGVHIVDAPHGPLVGVGRFRRMLPFAATASISMLIAVPTSSWARQGLPVAALSLVAAAFVVTLVVPWQRVPRTAQLIPAYLLLFGTLLFAHATGHGIASPFTTMCVLPFMWLAIYETKIAVFGAAALAGIALWSSMSDHNSPVAVNTVAYTAVFIVVCIGMGITLNALVTDARKSASELHANQVALEQSAEVLEALPDLISRYRVSDHVVTYCNSAWANEYSIGPAEPVGHRLEVFLSEDELAGLRQQLALLGPDNPILMDTFPRNTGHPSGEWLEWVDRYLLGPDGPEILSIGRDVTRRKNAELHLAETEAGFRDLADRSADVVWRFSLVPAPHFDYMSPSVENISGYPASYFLEDFSRLLNVVDSADTKAIAQAIKGQPLPDRFDITFRHANGSLNIVETHTSIISGGLQGVSRDVTELRRLQDEMAALALRDPLTGLANRRLFNELLDAGLARTQRDDLPLAVAFLDLDGLKLVNDVFGHDAGDIVLCETASRLREVLRGADTVARLGGDEFAIIYSPNDANSFNLIARIDRALAKPIEISDTDSVICPASIGTADTRTVGYSGEALLAVADEAMYDTKRARKAARDPETRSRVETRGIEPLTSTLQR
ncbi:hypothetical protein BH10ACT2_BH10ACT2_13550 [soil metagenome]